MDICRRGLLWGSGPYTNKNDNTQTWFRCLWFLYFVAIVGASVVCYVLYESESILGTSYSILNSQYETKTASYESQQPIKKESR